MEKETDAKKPVYCHYCGSLLMEYEKDTYDVYTGKKERGIACSRLNCERYCGVVVPHAWSKNPFITPKCIRCGYVIYDY